MHRGIQAAVGRLQLFADADGATLIQEFAQLEQAVTNGADVAIGSRALASQLPGYTVQCRATTQIPYRRNPGELVASAQLKVSRHQR